MSHRRILRPATCRSLIKIKKRKRQWVTVIEVTVIANFGFQSGLLYGQFLTAFEGH